MDPDKVYGRMIKIDPGFVESSEYLAYTDAIQKYLSSGNNRLSTITVKLPITVMRAEHTWDFEGKFLGSFEKLGQKFYTCSIHVTMTGFDMYIHKKKTARESTLEF